MTLIDISVLSRRSDKQRGIGEIV